MSLLPPPQSTRGASPQGMPQQARQPDMSAVNPAQAQKFIQYVHGQSQSDAPPEDMGPAHVRIPRHLVGKRQYKKYAGYLLLVSVNCCLIHFAQWYPAIRALVIFMYLSLPAMALIDTLKQTNTRGYTDRNFYRKLAITYTFIAIAMVLFHVYILWI